MSSEKDLQLIGDDYYDSLQELTFNSRTIISSLTVLAQENIPAAKYITAAITKRIAKCVPGQKLFALYLMDSVCKNVGSPYTILFAQSLPAMFIETYTLVDDAHRKKMIDLFRTWKVAKTTSGLPIFPPDPILLIEKFLLKVAKSNSPAPGALSQPQTMRRASPRLSASPLLSSGARPSATFHSSVSASASGSHPKPLTSRALINDIENLQAIVSGRLGMSPNDKTSAQKLTILSQLKNILASQSLSPPELASIQSQLRGITDTEKLSLKKSESPAPANYVSYNNNNNNSNNSNSSSSSHNALPPNLQFLAPASSQQSSAPANPVAFLQQLQSAAAQPGFLHNTNSGIVNSTSNNNISGINNTKNVNSLGILDNPLAILSSLNKIANGSSNPPLYNTGASNNNNISTTNSNNSNSPAQPPINMSSLLQTLQSTGIIKPNKAPPPASNNGPAHQARPETPKPASNGKIKPLINLPSTSILQNILFNTKPASSANANTNVTASEEQSKGKSAAIDYSGFQLTNSSISQKSSDVRQVQRLLFEAKPIKCNNCGKRFSLKEDSQKHLDWHFRVNKRLKDSSSINTRSFYLTRDQFANFKESEILGDDGQDSNLKTSGAARKVHSSGISSDARGDTATGNGNQDPSTHYIVIPDDCIDMTAVCNVCKDTLKGAWNDEKGEWIWRNAISMHGKIYHWTCYNETQESRSKDQSGGKRRLEGGDDGDDGEGGYANKKPNLLNLPPTLSNLI